MTSERSIQRDIDNYCKNCNRFADQKAKIREWAKKTFTPENMEDKFGITVTKYECENLLKEFEEL